MLVKYIFRKSEIIFTNNSGVISISARIKRNACQLQPTGIEFIWTRCVKLFGP